MSNTPRTDAAEVTMLRLDGDEDVVVAAFFARQLERENAELLAALKEIEDHHNETEEWREIARAAIAAIRNNTNQRELI